MTRISQTRTLRHREGVTCSHSFHVEEVEFESCQFSMPMGYTTSILQVCVQAGLVAEPSSGSQDLQIHGQLPQPAEAQSTPLETEENDRTHLRGHGELTAMMHVKCLT